MLWPPDLPAVLLFCGAVSKFGQGVGVGVAWQKAKNTCNINMCAPNPQKRTFIGAVAMPALCPKADSCTAAILSWRSAQA